MKSDFSKFPSTPHLFLPDGVHIRGDKVLSLSQRQALLSNYLFVEEKIDGANLGISFDEDGGLLTQNRGAYLQLPASGQWKKLEEWLLPRMDGLRDALVDRYILFGEWCYAQHSVFYDRLPDLFLGFDVYDKLEKKFLSTSRRDTVLSKMGVVMVPAIARGRFTVQSLAALLGKSKYGTQSAEGLYLRHDEGDWLVDRAKLVRPAFVQSIEAHWSRSPIRLNRVTGEIHV